MNQNSKMKLILIDDDKSFRSIMKANANKLGIELDTFDSLEDLGFVSMIGKYSAAIIDFDLGAATGVEIANYTNILLKNVPVVLISSIPRQDNIKWPANIKKFVNKNEGYDVILKIATQNAA